ncbi:hypothetical protein EVAR_65535_1 [Eumeta japonica]|uniref:Uncharacterized protein n=1 Tax=Eumeta variegata TaxID=151549 RepID=A0A4C1ZYE2_EUMVA|nr:hypothetical protein EVAR_65535_1 [Eumeta japonica]
MEEKQAIRPGVDVYTQTAVPLRNGIIIYTLPLSLRIHLTFGLRDKFQPQLPERSAVREYIAACRFLSDGKLSSHF